MVDFMKEVINTGYQGYFSHEIFNDEFRSSPCRPTAVDGMRSMLWLQEEVAKVTPDLVEPYTKNGDYMPPEASIEAFEFIEFAAEGGARDELIALLRCLGFSKTHIHKSKDVSLYRQGDVCIVVNEEPDSFAQNSYLVHGVSVCAVAYLTDDAEGMAERAAHYGYNKFESDIDSGEMNIPGIKGVGGELVYFVQKHADGMRFYDVDFVAVEPDPGVEPQPSIAMVVDHISSGVSESEFLSTSLFFKVLFGLDIAQPQDLIDPYGIVVSRTATSKDKKIRLPFNMSKSWGASTERFREEHKGSGVQHIAFNCDDVIGLAKSVDQNIILPIPENYYDDLEARYDLDHQLLADLRNYNLLYDQSETGDFIHFYTRAINGVFFEMVQRNKYRNYGEMNAQVRMAAQSRLRKAKLAKG
jgi:4-hydroxyphenylpyruvate dioxygenase